MQHLHPRCLVLIQTGNTSGRLSTSCIGTSTLSPQHAVVITMTSLVPKLVNKSPDSNRARDDDAGALKVFNHCHNGCVEVMDDYFGRGGSVFASHGGMKQLQQDGRWYHNLRPNKKENETAKHYVRRICFAGKQVEALVQKDMTEHGGCSTNL